MYESRQGLTGPMVCFFLAGIDLQTGEPLETELCREPCLQAIENIKAERASYATQEAFERFLSVYEGAARFMGWLE